MLPTLLAPDIQQGLQQLLVIGFVPSDDFLHGLMRRFVEDQSRGLNGPYLQVGLPFAAGQSERKFFCSFDMEFPGFRHQEAAWHRLSSHHLVDHTLVVTGADNGKTECFVCPVLGHCARAGKAGITPKARYLCTDAARTELSMTKANHRAQILRDTYGAKHALV